MFELGDKTARVADESDLVPHWIAPGEHRVERPCTATAVHDGDHVHVDFVRNGSVGNSAARGGRRRWRRLTEERAGSAKSVFQSADRPTRRGAARTGTGPMFDTTDQIRNQIRAGEDGRAEFQAVRVGERGVLSPSTEDLAAELVAFANDGGGAVFLGVDDSGAVEGIPPDRLDVVERWTINISTHNCEPPIRPILRKVLLPAATGGERHVLVAEVPRGLSTYTARRVAAITSASAPRNATSRPRSSPGCSNSADASTYSTSSPSSPPPSTTSTATDSRPSSDGRRPSPGSTCSATRA